MTTAVCLQMQNEAFALLFMNAVAPDVNVSYTNWV